MSAADIASQIQTQAGGYNPTALFQGAYQPTQGAVATNNSAQQAIQNTTGLLNQVTPSYQVKTAGSDLTSAGATKLAENASAPLQTQLQGNARTAQDANASLMPLLGQAQLQAENQVQGKQQQESYLEQLLKSQSTAEQKSASDAEQQREFGLELQDSKAKAAASAAKAAAKSSASSAFKGNYNTYSPQDWESYINAQFQGQSWGQVAKQLEGSYGKIPTGSNLDQALHHLYTGVY